MIGPGCRIEAGVEVRDSVLLDDCPVGAGATVAGSILAAGVEVEPARPSRARWSAGMKVPA